MISLNLGKTPLQSELPSFSIVLFCVVRVFGVFSRLDSMMKKYGSIPCVRMNEEQYTEAIAVLDRGNKLFRKWSVFAKTAKSFLSAVMSGQENPLGVIPDDKITEFTSDRPIMMAARTLQIDDTRTIEQAVLQHFSAMVCRFSHKYSQSNTAFDFFDLSQEGYIQIIDCMYAWLAEYNVSLSTFIHVSLKRKYNKIMNSGNLLCPLTNSDLDLILNYRAIQSTKKTTLDDAAEKLNLTDVEFSRLNRSLSVALVQSDFCPPSSNKDQTGNDYSYFGVVQQKCVDVISEQQEVEFILQKANLSPIEMKLIRIAMDPYPGWQTEFAKNNISKKTGKPYSRMRISQIVEIARTKVATVIESRGR